MFMYGTSSFLIAFKDGLHEGKFSVPNGKCLSLNLRSVLCTVSNINVIVIKNKLYVDTLVRNLCSVDVS